MHIVTNDLILDWIGKLDFHFLVSWYSFFSSSLFLGITLPIENIGTKNKHCILKLFENRLMFFSGFRMFCFSWISTKKNNIFLDWRWLKKHYIVIKGLKFFHLVTDQIDSFCFVFFNKVFIAEKKIYWIFGFSFLFIETIITFYFDRFIFLIFFSFIEWHWWWWEYWFS